ncbi:2'-5' RNA ligase family protein [Thermoflavimicrobium dichotomicum]|uniref:Putative phosphoesterase SAMN05421852_10479 n=1 Tax=Thermoflavimicrobium dichotomicum TaxID=46223 RepID=A0A1I3NBE6_9BACL|nr:2'-5' RNA ligase family protein [Thermoflavimicrobium dichotomicum]SFJ06671.1 2'-5' RNA ligase [Thermoflavimicrobium dichotomicum]
MYFGIAVFPQRHVQDLANSYRKRYDPHYSLIAPHITLIEKFSLPEEEMFALIPEFEEIAKNTDAFTIHINKVSHFFPNSPTIYLAIENHEPLIDLHNKLRQILDWHQPAYDFIPHLTIGQKMLEDELLDVYGSLRMHRFNLTSLVDRFHLLYQLENGSWVNYQSFLLNK